MSFEEYLKGKKMDPGAFKAQEPAQWEAWEKVFPSMHPNSFTAQKLYLINALRRRFPLKETVEQPVSGLSQVEPVSPSSSPKPSRPVMKPRPKMN